MRERKKGDEGIREGTSGKRKGSVEYKVKGRD